MRRVGRAAASAGRLAVSLALAFALIETAHWRLGRLQSIPLGRYLVRADAVDRLGHTSHQRSLAALTIHVR